MAKRYRKRYYKRRNTLEEDFFGLLAFLVLWVILGVAYNVYKSSLRIMTFLSSYESLFLYVFSGILGLLLAMVVFSLYRKLTTNKVEITNELARNIVNEIRTFKPSKNYPTEQQYHMELSGFLKRTFSGLTIEEISGNTRPDIIIGDIAIEVKGPTGGRELATIADKIIRYLKHYNHIVVVLFNVEVSRDAYTEWYADIMDNFAHKGDKISIITI